MSSKKKGTITNPYKSTGWLKRLDPHDIGEPTHKTLKKKPRVTPQKKKTPTKEIKLEPGIKSNKGSIHDAIDLTGTDELILPLPVPPLAVLKIQNPVFFSYNPYGYPRNTTLPVGCCLSCRCPEAYCAERVFGEMVLKQAEYEVYVIQGMAKINPHDVDELRTLFETIYTDAVKHKMMWNNINLPVEFRTNHIISVPNCIKNKSLRRFVLNYRYECKTDEESSVSSPITIDEDDSFYSSTKKEKPIRKHFSY